MRMMERFREAIENEDHGKLLRLLKAGKKKRDAVGS
jgi:hypothetical protein